MPTEEVFKRVKWHIAGFMPDFHEHRTLGYKSFTPFFGKIHQEIKLHFMV
tara:strand:- start:403 stop:552 length:150 start_codon:yes stop_codon:yes gene_type:complete